MKRIISLLVSVVVSASVFSPMGAGAASNYEEAAAVAEDAEINYSRTIPIEVKGNKIVEEGTDNLVVLRGVNVPSLGWGMAEHLYESMTQVYDSWQGNLIRLPIQPKYWFNGNYDESKGMAMSAEEYRQHIDDMVAAAQARGKYIILDCHTYVMPVQESLDMWLEVAAKYANNSAVLFGLLNEPHDIKPAGVDSERSVWDVWRNGGQITISGEEVTGIGHQQLLEAIRSTGANNICIAGGLNWAFDISGLADGYDGLENGYRLTDTPEGKGVMYDSHAYPSKGAKSSWDETIGPVRKVAPILIGEWGWDSSDKAISGGDCTSDIWMNQIMNWMDDTYGEYDGVPVNWTGWNLHMSSTPRMILSWDFKTTPYNGTYIKERLMSYGNDPQKLDGVYSSDFSDKDVFRSYTGQSGKSSVTYSEENENVVVYHQPAEWSAKLDFPYEWDLNGIQTITMDISSDISESVNIGLYGADMEAWTKTVDIDNTVQTVTIRVDELRREGNALTDGILDGALSGIYIGANSSEKANITIDNVKIVKLADTIYTPVECSHTDTGEELYFDIDNTDFESQQLIDGPADTSYFKSENTVTEEYDGEDTTVKKISYNRTDGPWGGSAQYNLSTVPTMEARYFTVCLKGSGTAQTIGVSIGDIASFNAVLEEGDTDWHQYIFCLDGNVEYPEDIQYIKFTSGTKTESYFYADNFGFSIEKPERVIPYPEKTFVYDFATYKKNTTKYEAQLKLQQGSDTISAQKVDGGLDFETSALEISYSRSGDDPSKVRIVYSSSDFFKSNVNDDERTAGRSSLKADMEYMTDLVFYGKSTSGKNETIKLGVLDAADSMSTPTDEKEFVLTDEWQQFRVPFDEFNVLDGGMPLDCSRVRGFVISSAEESGEGSFLIDNITHTSESNIDWSVPTPTPSPTATVTPSSTPEATKDPSPTTAPGEPRVVTTAEEILALTTSDSYIILGDDINVANSQVKPRCNMTLDLNGYTLSGGGNGVIDATSDLVIVDSSEAQTGKVYNTGTGTSSYGVKAAKNITIKSGSVIGGQAVLASSSSGTDYKLVVEGGTYLATNSNGFSFNVSNHDVWIKNCTASHPTASGGGVMKIAGESSADIENGIFTSGGIVINDAATSGEVNINGGSFSSSGKGKGVLYLTSNGTMNVYGGTFENTSEDNPVAVQIYRNAGGTVNLYSGAYTGAVGKDSASSAVLTVYGGTYSNDPSQFVDDNSSVNLGSDGRYTVSSGTSEGYTYEVSNFDSEKITVTVTKSPSAPAATVYTAAYDADGVLTGVFLETDIQQQNVYEYETPENTESVKVFVWDDKMCAQ